MRRKLLVAGALVAVAVASVATYAFATSTADAVIHACVAKADGSVRIVAAANACKNNEASVDWSQQGPAGPQGAQGRDGAQGPAGPAAPSPDAIQATAEIVGAKSGPIAGDGPNGKVIVIAVSHEIVSPRDLATGQSSGKRQHKPLTIRKEIDKSTPLLYKAVTTNEVLSSVTLTYFKGGSPVMTVKLTNANIASLSQSGGTESLSFTYQKITWTWIDGGITHSDDWEAPVA